MSDVLPYLSKEADELCFIKSMHTEAINHDPAITFCQTGHQLAGRPSIGSWLSYGLGTENKDLPAYVVMTSWGTGRPNDQPLYDRLWGAGFLPAKQQGTPMQTAEVQPKRTEEVLSQPQPRTKHQQRRTQTEGEPNVELLKPFDALLDAAHR